MKWSKNERAKEINEAKRVGERVDITEVLLHFLYTDLTLSPRRPGEDVPLLFQSNCEIVNKSRWNLGQ